MLSRRLTAALLSAPLLMATACGDVEREMPNDKVAKRVSLPAVTPTIGSPPPSSSSAAPTQAATSAAATGAASAPAAKPGEVQATIDNKFTPATIQVKAGEEVTWINVAGVHSVTGGADALDPASPIGDNQLAAAGATVKKTFAQPGTYPYFCTPHLSLGMKGQVVVA